MNAKNVLVIYSGGLDSTVLLYHYKAQGCNVRALGVDYGQRHVVELEFARRNCEALDIPFTVADLRSLAALLPGSSQTSSDVEVPEGHYASESMKVTVVPNRNMIMLAVAAGHAIAHKCETVAFAAHNGDHAIYPDCRSEFVEQLGKALALCDWLPVTLDSPFVTWTKSEIVAYGAKLGVHFENTWSCYKGGRNGHCGKCGTCVERREAFALAGVPDPTYYTV